MAQQQAEARHFLAFAPELVPGLTVGDRVQVLDPAEMLSDAQETGGLALSPGEALQAGLADPLDGLLLLLSARAVVGHERGAEVPLRMAISERCWPSKNQAFTPSRRTVGDPRNRSKNPIARDWICQRARSTGAKGGP